MYFVRVDTNDRAFDERRSSDFDIVKSNVDKLTVFQMHILNLFRIASEFDDVVVELWPVSRRR